MSPESGRNSGGDLFGMAKDGTTVPDDATKPRIIPSVPRPGQYGTPWPKRLTMLVTLPGGVSCAILTVEPIPLLTPQKLCLIPTGFAFYCLLHYC